VQRKSYIAMRTRSQGCRGTNCRVPCGWGCALRARGWDWGRAKWGVKEERFGQLESAAMQAAHVCVNELSSRLSLAVLSLSLFSLSSLQRFLREVERVRWVGLKWLAFLTLYLIDLQVVWRGSKSKHCKDICLKEIRRRFQISIIVLHSIVNTNGMIYICSHFHKSLNLHL
jgi:hypothetical protein